jgi:hypothetical protein
MGAASEYYGYLLSQGYGESQLKEFAQIAGRADRGEISHNQAYKLACKAGYGQADGDSWGYADDNKTGKKTFGDWVDTAQQAGWIDGAIGLIGGAIKNRKDKNDGGGGGGYGDYPPPPPPPEGLSRGAKIGIGVGALAVVGVVIYLVMRKK